MKKEKTYVTPKVRVVISAAYEAILTASAGASLPGVEEVNEEFIF